MPYTALHGLVLERSQVTLVDKFTVACEGSDVGLAPGEWPDLVLLWVDADHRMTMAFTDPAINESGDHIYISHANACFLTILND